MTKLNLDTVDERAFCIAVNKILTENGISPMLHSKIISECKESGVGTFIKKEGIPLSEEAVIDFILKEIEYQ